MNPRQQAFVSEYLSDRIGWKAAQRAGYMGSQRTLEVTASRMLSKNEIKEAIARKLAQADARAVSRVEYTRERWLKRMIDIAEADIGDAFQPDANGKLTMKIEDMKKSGFTKLVRKFKVLPGGKVEFDMYSALQAMEILGKTFGWIKEHMELSGAVKTHPDVQLTEGEFKEIFSNDETAALALQLAEKMKQKTPAEIPAEGTTQ